MSRIVYGTQKTRENPHQLEKGERFSFCEYSPNEPVGTPKPKWITYL